MPKKPRFLDVRESAEFASWFEVRSPGGLERCPHFHGTRAEAAKCATTKAEDGMSYVSYWGAAEIWGVQTALHQRITKRARRRWPKKRASKKSR